MVSSGAGRYKVKGTGTCGGVQRCREGKEVQESKSLRGLRGNTEFHIQFQDLDN